MPTALPRPFGAALLLGALAAAAGLVGVATAQPSVPQRTHTFGSYYKDAVTKALVPVFVTTDKFLQGTYAQDDIVSLANGANLTCGGDVGLGMTQCDLKEVWYKRRSDPGGNYAPLPFGPTSPSGCDPFVMKFESGLLRLVVSPQCLGKTIYNDFGDPDPSARQLAWGSGGGKGKNYALKGAAKAAKDNVMDPNMGVYYDPWAPVGVSVCMYIRAYIVNSTALIR